MRRNTCGSGLLLRADFPEAQDQMVTSIINPKGVARVERVLTRRRVRLLRLHRRRTGRCVVADDMISSSRPRVGEPSVTWRGSCATGTKGPRTRPRISSIRSSSMSRDCARSTRLARPFPSARHTTNRSDARRDRSRSGPSAGRAPKDSWRWSPETLRAVLAAGASERRAVQARQGHVALFTTSRAEPCQADRGRVSIEVVGHDERRCTAAPATADGSCKKSIHEAVWNRIVA